MMRNEGGKQASWHTPGSPTSDRTERASATAVEPSYTDERLESSDRNAMDSIPVTRTSRAPTYTSTHTYRVEASGISEAQERNRVQASSSGGAGTAGGPSSGLPTTLPGSVSSSMPHSATRVHVAAPATTAVSTAGGETIIVDARSYVDVDALPMTTAQGGRGIRPWHYGLFHTCNSCDTCLEAWCCTPCQISRQCQMVLNGKSGMHWPFCIFIVVTDIIVISTVSVIFVCQTRDLARKRYAIRGSCWVDCCVACCCRPCAVQQMLLEMTVNGDCPGGFCLSGGDPPNSPHQMVEMV